MSVRDLVIDCAATYRIVRLVTEDDFPPVKAVRDRILERHVSYDTDGVGHPDSIAELVQCPWCASWWVALGVIAARRFVPRLWDPAARGFVFSLASGLLATRVDTA